MRHLLNLIHPQPKVSAREKHYRRIMALEAEGRHKDADAYYMAHQSISYEVYAAAVAAGREAR